MGGRGAYGVRVGVGAGGWVGEMGAWGVRGVEKEPLRRTCPTVRRTCPAGEAAARAYPRLLLCADPVRAEPAGRAAQGLLERCDKSWASPEAAHPPPPPLTPPLPPPLTPPLPSPLFCPRGSLPRRDPLRNRRRRRHLCGGYLRCHRRGRRRLGRSRRAIGSAPNETRLRRSSGLGGVSGGGSLPARRGGPKHRLRLVQRRHIVEFTRGPRASLGCFRTAQWGGVGWGGGEMACERHGEHAVSDTWARGGVCGLPREIRTQKSRVVRMGEHMGKCGPTRGGCVLAVLGRGL